MQSLPAAAPVPEAFCPEHPGQAPSGTCRRCGRFVCGSCSLQEGTCSECQQRRFRELPSAAKRARWTRWLLGARVVGALFTVAGNLWTFAVLDGSLTRREDFGAYVAVAKAVNPLIAGVALAIIVAFLMWLHLAVRTTNALGLSDESPRWAMFCWFIPVASFIKPYQLVSDLWANVEGGRPRRPVLSAWWVTWLLANLLRFVSQNRMEAYAQDRALLPGALLVGTLAEACFLVSALLCMRVVADIQRGLDTLRAEARDEG